MSYRVKMIKKIVTILRWLTATRLRRVVSSVTIIALIAGPLSYIVFKPQSVEAAWWNDSWAYRKSVAVTNSAADQANVYVQATIDTSDTTRFNANCSDLRFTDANGTLLSYYIVSGCRTASTVVNVLFDNLIAGASTVYYYYGNPSASLAASPTNFTTAASSYSVGSIGSEEKGTGPVAYWSFDEGTGTTANDETSNKYSGTLTNMSATASSTSGWQTEDACVAGKCLAFDGGNDAINTTFAVPASASPMTISLWFKWNGLGDTTRQTIIDNYGSGGVYDRTLAVYYERGTTNRIRLLYGAASSEGIDGLADIQANSWIYLTGVYDGSTVKLYINGALVNSGNYSPDYWGNSYSIGRSPVATRPFSGLIDEPKIYNYARSAAQVKLDYNAGLAGTSGRAAAEGASVSVGSRSAKWLANGLVGWWKMDEASWNGTAGEVKDYSGLGNNGTAAGTTGGTASTTAGKFGNAGSFDGTDDYVQTSSVSNFITKNGSYAVSVWVRPTDVTNHHTIIQNSLSSVDRNGVSIYNGIVSFGYYDGSNWQGASGTISANTWTHLLGINNGGVLKLYINGVLQTGSVAPYVNAIDTSHILIGKDSQSSPDSPYFFTGSLDDLRIYNRALSDREVRDLYNYAPGPVGWWKMEEGSGQYAYDSSGNQNTGTLGSGATADSADPAWATGKQGKGLRFDGVDDYVKVSTSLFPSGNTNYGTVEMWIKPTLKTGGLSSVFGIRGVTAYNKSRLLLYFDTGSSNLTYLLQNTDGTTAYNGSIGMVMGQWNHVAVTFGSGGITAYRNGARGNSTVDVWSVTESYNSNMYIGSGESATASFNGQIDDIKVYNYARTPEQIMEDMNARGTTAEGGGATAAVSASGKTAVGYWKFDEGYGDTANDSSPQRNNGDLAGACPGAATCPTWTNNGKFGKALSFDGTDDYVDIGKSVYSPSASQDLSFGAWVKVGDLSVAKHVLSTDDGSGPYYWLGLSSSEKPTAYIYESTCGNSDYIEVAADNSISQGVWHYLFATLNRNTNLLSLYIDGSLAKTGSASTIGDLSCALNDLEIGRKNAGGTVTYFPGQIDEVKIYNFALTPEDIKAEYNKGSTLKIGSFSQSSTGVASSSAASLYCVPGSSDPCAPPVGEWKFEEGSGQTAYDTSGSGNNGTLGSGATADASDPTYVSGKSGKALKFDGSNDYVKTNDINQNMGSACGWFKPRTAINASSPNTYLLSSDDINRIQFGASTGLLTNEIVSVHTDTNIARNGWCSATESISPDWHYLCTRWNGTINEIYLDGILKNNCTAGTAVQMSGDVISIGGSTTGTFNFDGIIDEIKIYNYARTASQIAWDYNRGGPVGYWKLDEGQGGLAHDSSGNKNDGLIYPGTGGTQTATSTMWTNGAAGKRNGSLNFDGTDDYVSLGTRLSSYFKSEISISGWAYVSSSATGEHGFVHFGGNSPDTPGFYSRIRSANSGSTPTFVLGNGTSRDTQSFSTRTPLDRWFHIALVTDGITKKLYLDGILKDTLTLTIAGPFTPGVSEEAAIGWGYNNTEKMLGRLDDVQVFNYALTAQQVKTLYSGGAASFR